MKAILLPRKLICFIYSLGIIGTITFVLLRITSRLVGLWLLRSVILRYRCLCHRYRFFARADDWWRFVNYFEPRTTIFIEKIAKPTDVVVDVGAHIGIHTVHFAKKVRAVIAIEPEPQNFELLKRNIDLNGLNNVLALPIALSSYDGHIEFCISTSSGGHSVERREGCIAKVRVPCMCMDALVNRMKISKIDIVKIDVEGHEHKVLEGMAGTLANAPPKVLIVEMDKDSELIDELRNRYEYRYVVVLDNWGKRVNYAFIRDLRN